MLAIVSSDNSYVKELLEKFMISKEQCPNLSEVYKCKYNNHEFIIGVLGYGKVNIGSSLRFLYDRYNIKAVVVIGTAGSITDTNDIFSCVIANSSLQFDVDFMPNGYQSAQLPGLSKSMYKADVDLSDCIKRASNLCGVNYQEGVIASSDMFVSNYNLANSIRREYDALAVDTESGNIGQFCFINDISYASVKVISNFANNNGIKQYNLYDDESSIIVQRIADKFLKDFYEA